MNTRTVRATWTEPDGTTTSVEAASLTAPFADAVEASFEVTPRVTGQHVLEAFLEPGAVRSTVEVIVASDRTTAPVFEEALSPSLVAERFDRRYVARTTAGLLIVSTRLTRGGLPATPPQGWPSDPLVVVAVGNIVWTYELPRDDAQDARVARWRDDGTQLVLEDDAAVSRYCYPHFASAVSLFCSTPDVRHELTWNGTALDGLEVATGGTSQMAFAIGDRRLTLGKVPEISTQRSVLCEVEPLSETSTCHETTNLHGLSPAGPLVRNWSTNTLGVLGREGRSWSYSSGGLVTATDTVSGLVDDQAVALESALINADLPPANDALLLTADSAGLLFQRYRLGPVLTVNEPPHQILAVLHDWVVVSRSGVRDRVFFIARR